MANVILPITGEVLVDHGFRVDCYRPFDSTALYSQNGPGAGILFQGEQIIGVLGNPKGIAGFKGSEPEDDENFAAWVLDNVAAGSLGGNASAETLIDALIDEAHLNSIIDRVKSKGYILGSLTREDGGIELQLLNHFQSDTTFELPVDASYLPKWVRSAARERRARVWGENGWLFV